MATRKRKTIPRSVKNELWNKHFDNINGKCLCCGKVISVFDFEAGHVIAHAENGSDDISNLRPICSTCNRSMGTQNMDEFKQTYFGSNNQQVDEKELTAIKNAIEVKYDQLMKKQTEALEEEYEEKKQKIIDDIEKKIMHEKQVAEKEWRLKHAPAKNVKTSPEQTSKYVEVNVKMKSARLNNIIKNIIDGKSPIRMKINANEKNCAGHIFHLTQQQSKQVETMKDSCELILDKDQINHIKEVNFTSDGFITKLHRRLNAVEESDEEMDLDTSLEKVEKVKEQIEKDLGIKVSSNEIKEGKYTVKQLKDMLNCLQLQGEYNSKMKKSELQEVLMKQFTITI